jgi:hypothetical protein
MAKVEVIVEGSALWVPRRDSWSVLFPKAVGGNPQHTPYLSYTVNDGPASKWVSIAGKCVHLVGVPSEPKAKQLLTWLHRLSSTSGSDVRGAACTPKATVIAELHLPRRTLLAGDRTFVGPIMDPETDIVDHYWCHASKIEFDLTEPNAEVRSVRLDGPEQADDPTFPLDPAATHITVLIRNLTQREVDGHGSSTKQNEVLDEMQDLFAVAGVSHRSPIYTGPDLQPESPAAFATKGVRASIYRLCPQGYCDDCPDD